MKKRIKEKELNVEGKAKVVEILEPSATELSTPDFYTLRIGETLKDVAKKFNLSEEKLASLNGKDVFGGNQIKLKG